MNDVMLDLETMGNTPGSAIMSIGVVAFDKNSVATDGDYILVYRGGRDCGLHIDKSTQAWWKQQAPEARQVISDCKSDKAVDLRDALDALDAYVLRYGGRDCRVWGCGADFDNALIRAAYRAVREDREPVWAFWNNRCYRTLKSLFPMTSINRTGVHHNALDDAIAQAEHAGRLLQRFPE